MAEADGSSVKAITEPGAFTESAGWSPNGDWIVFNKKSGPIGVKGSDLYLVRPDGSGLHAITTGSSPARATRSELSGRPTGAASSSIPYPGARSSAVICGWSTSTGPASPELTDARAPVFGYSWQPGK